MSTGMKIAVGSAIVGALFALLNGHLITAAWAFLAAYWMWKHTQLEHRYNDLSITDLFSGGAIDAKVHRSIGSLLDNVEGTIESPKGIRGKPLMYGSKIQTCTVGVHDKTIVQLNPKPRIPCRDGNFKRHAYLPSPGGLWPRILLASCS